MAIYLDNAATTAMRPEVISAMVKVMSDTYGNASSVHSFGREARKLIDAARRQVAAAIGAEPKEIYFTGSGTEADNWAILGMAETLSQKGRHIITTQIEHHAVLHVCEHLQKLGYEVTYLPVDEYGLVSVDDFINALRPDTIFATIMAANNEIGTIQPIAEIGAICSERGVKLHTDAVQAIGSIQVNVNDMNVDLLSLSAHKFGGPKGVGVLYCRSGVPLPSMIMGGAHERGKRAGTENVAGIVGLGVAIELATKDISGHAARLATMRDRLIEGLVANIPDIRLNGHPQKRLPGNVNVSVRFIEGEALLLRLDLKGIAASSGSACTSGSLDPSHVLLAIGLPHEIAHGSLRLTLSENNTQAEIDEVIKTLPPIVESLRQMSPLFAQNKEGKSYV